MFKKTSLAVILFSAIFLAGCFHNQSQAPAAADLESINVTLEGTLGAPNPNGEYSLQTAQGPKLLHDGNASLAPYVGQNVQVTGQYSGTTLYVDEVAQ